MSFFTINLPSYYVFTFCPSPVPRLYVVSLKKGHSLKEIKLQNWNSPSMIYELSTYLINLGLDNQEKRRLVFKDRNFI